MDDERGKSKRSVIGSVFARELSILERRKVCPARYYCNALRCGGRPGPLCPACDAAESAIRLWSRVMQRTPLLDLLTGEEGPFFGC